MGYAAAPALAILLAIATPTSAGKPPELAPTELAGLQNQYYAVPPKIAFNAALSTLQSLGFTDVNANRDAGTITAITEAKAKTLFNIFWGFGKKKYTMKASLLVEEMGAGTQVRLNLHLNETKSRGIFGTSFSDGVLIRQGDPYRDFYAVMNREVQNRTANSAAASPGSVIAPGGGVRLVPADTPSGFCIAAPQGYVGTGSASRPVATSAQPLCK